MATIRQNPVPPPLAYLFKQQGIKLKKFTTAAVFERELKKFLQTNHVLHLSTSKGDVPRSTPLEFRFHDMKFFILSEGGAKFENLRHNKKVSFSIAAPYNSEENYISYKGVQAFGTAKVYSRKDTPKEFMAAFRKMKVGPVMKKMGMKELPKEFNYRIIEIIPDRLKYGNPLEGIYWTHWQRKGE
jgi:nitroimidazol reductase NimA-like FMN-containing flavoprotein (pyridoxamine 5'-phosphate oxidase superfamily)